MNGEVKCGVLCQCCFADRVFLLEHCDRGISVVARLYLWCLVMQTDDIYSPEATSVGQQCLLSRTLKLDSKLRPQGDMGVQLDPEIDFNARQ